MTTNSIDVPPIHNYNCIFDSYKWLVYRSLTGLKLVWCKSSLVLPKFWTWQSVNHSTVWYFCAWKSYIIFLTVSIHVITDAKLKLSNFFNFIIGIPTILEFKNTYSCHPTNLLRLALLLKFTYTGLSTYLSKNGNSSKIGGIIKAAVSDQIKVIVLRPSMSTLAAFCPSLRGNCI